MEKDEKALSKNVIINKVIYYFSKKITTYTQIKDICERDKFIFIIMNDRIPSRGTFANFLNNIDPEIIHRVFVSTLVIINELKVLKNDRVFNDGTNVVIRGSRNYLYK